MEAEMSRRHLKICEETNASTSEIINNTDRSDSSLSDRLPLKSGGTPAPQACGSSLAAPDVKLRKYLKLKNKKTSLWMNDCN